jgi:lipopolysaccharide/colanic/teichoic acid biosynthesis glycosyltransferase
MRWLVLLIVDVALILLATILALFLRENFEVSLNRLTEFAPYLLATLATALFAFPFAGLNRSVWRFSNLNDNLAITGSVAMAVAGAAGLAFAYNRLEGVARSLPFLQFLTGTAFLTGARALHRLGHEFRRDRKAAPAFLRPAPEEKQAKTGLIVGVTPLAEAYLRAAAELTPRQVRIAGIVSCKERHTGRLLAAHRVLGSSDDLGEILDSLEVHGVTVDFIAVAIPFLTLSPQAQAALIAAERERVIELRFLAEDWGLSAERPAPAASPSELPELPDEIPSLFEIPSALLETYALRRYWAVKRVIDFSGAIILVLLLCPIMLLTAFLVVASIGWPIFFWQQRPGLGGRPFRVYKFRTMRSAHKADGSRLSDDERVSSIGKMLRRLRLDELPQLFNIVRGDMSFIGPRPLLEHDQSKAYSTRLFVRPGLTGWAQVVGGRDIAPVDKAALDVWYLCNAGVTLDVEIFLRTIQFVLLGEPVAVPHVERAWQELGEKGVIGEEVSLTGRK